MSSQLANSPQSFNQTLVFLLFFFFWRGGGTLQYVGSWFPNQGLNRHPPHWKRSLNQWTAREVHRTSLDVAVKVCFPGGISVKEPPGNAEDAGDTGLIPESGRSPGGGYGNPLQYFCLENSMDRGACQAIVHRVTKSWTQLK